MKEKIVLGVSVIILGLIFLFSNLHIVSFKFFWPVFVLGPGLLFGYWFFKDRKAYGFLMPFSILTIIGFLFFVCEIFGWYLMRDLWPTFLIAPACGFFLMFYFGNKEKALLIPAFILFFLGLVFYAGNDIDTYFFPIALIAVGLWFLFFKNK